METLKMAGWPNCFSVSASSFPAHPSSPKRSRSTSSFSTGRVSTNVTATETISAPISIPSGLCTCSVSLSFAFPNQSSCFRCSRGKNQKAELPFHWLTKRSWPQHPNKQELSKRINCLIKRLACCKHTLSSYSILPLMEERTVPHRAALHAERVGTSVEQHRRDRAAGVGCRGTAPTHSTTFKRGAEIQTPSHYSTLL